MPRIPHRPRTKSPLRALALLALAAGAGACGDAVTATEPSPMPSALLVGALDPALASPYSAPMQNLFGYVESLSLGGWNRVVSGGSLTATVTLGGTRLGPSTVSLSSSDPSVATVPASVTVGVREDSAGFPVNAVPGAAGCAIIAARVGSTPPKAKIVFVLPPRTPASSPVQLRLSPGTVSVFDLTTTATIDLLEPIWGDGVVQLSSSHPAVTVPASVTVPLAQQEGGIRVGRLSFSIPSMVPVSSCAVITATKNGQQSRALLVREPLSGHAGSELY